MRTWCLFLLAPLIAGAQFPAPEMSGVLLECDANVAAGEFAVRAPDNQVYRFQFDARTLVERDGLSGDAGRLTPGDKVDVESGPVAGSLVRYARVVRVLTPVVRLMLADSRLRGAVRPALLEPAPQIGTLTFAGVVSRLNGRSLVLRTRIGEQTLLIRQDTRYVDNGDTVEAAELQPNMRVFVRAGKNVYEQVEAYQVIWGGILVPRQE
jgi:hypothetical protein